jgi:hypothetical protein
MQQTINPKDLRIGNWVHLYGKPHQILPMDLVYLYGEEDDYKDMYSYIPLTPEILEKNGFIIANDDQYYFAHNENKWFQLWPIPGGTSAVQLNLSGKFLRPSPMYVHELQNLYRWLTGPELNINLCN